MIPAICRWDLLGRMLQYLIDAGLIHLALMTDSN
jgi:hypothetical protein